MPRGSGSFQASAAFSAQSPQTSSITALAENPTDCAWPCGPTYIVITTSPAGRFFVHFASVASCLPTALIPRSSSHGIDADGLAERRSARDLEQALLDRPRSEVALGEHDLRDLAVGADVPAQHDV